MIVCKTVLTDCFTVYTIKSSTTTLASKTSSGSASTSSTKFPISVLPPAPSFSIGTLIGVCYGGFSVFLNTNATVCIKDSLDLARQASEVIEHN